MSSPAATGVATWHDSFHLKTDDQVIQALDKLLHTDVVFHSPVVHRPIEGKMATAMYLRAASTVLVNDSWVYTRQIIGLQDAALEFRTEIDGIVINGVDLIKFDDDARIVDFKVMVRPAKAVEKLHQMMMQALERLG